MGAPQDILTRGFYRKVLDDALVKGGPKFKEIIEKRMQMRFKRAGVSLDSTDYDELQTASNLILTTWQEVQEAVFKKKSG